jgi:hypothetical protein
VTSRHTGWARLRGSAASLAGTARKILGQVMEQRRLGGVGVAARTVVLADGTRVRAAFDGVTPIVDVQQPGQQEEQQQGVVEKALWIPDGFVLYPATATAAAGWGVPVQQIGGDPYAAANLAPGLEITRWTPGGPFGQVLLTRRVGAGFPRRAKALVPPLTYHAQAGLQLDKTFRPAAEGAWAAYRVEFAMFSAQSPGAGDGERVGQVLFKRGVFEMVNAHRAGMTDRDPLLLPFRGTYDPAQASAECAMSASVLGHMHAGFPLTYRTTEDRVTHDGLRRFDLAYNDLQGYNSRSYNFSENLLASFLGPVEVIGTDPNGVDILSGLMRRSPMFTSAEAVALWLDSPTHRAMIEREEHNVVPGTHGRAAVTNVGVRGSACAQHFLPTQHWIAAGNRQFISMHADVPIVSWVGPSTLNLCWETWPCRFRQAELNAAVGSPEAGLTPLAELARIVDSDGQCVLFRYYEMAAAENTRISQEPMWGPYIFCRGRCIAIAPRGGLVWACGVIRIREASAGQAAVDRLVALVHHDDEQPSGIANGMTSYIRIWYCDMPARDGLALNPQSFIRGVAGDESTDDPWPWTVENNPWSWRGGQMLDVGSSNGSDRDCLKYASQWVFRADGLEAVCLRDNSTLHGYLNDIWPVAPGASLPDYGGPPLFVVTGLWPSLWSMTFSAGEAPLAAGVTFHGRCPTMLTPQVLLDCWNQIYPDQPAVDMTFDASVYGFPVAAGYDAAGNISVAKLCTLDAVSLFNAGVQARGVSFGAYDAGIADSQFDGWTSTFKYSTGTIDRPYWSRPMMVDIEARAYVTAGVPQKFRVAAQNVAGEMQPRSFVDTAREALDWSSTTDPYATVSMWRGGEEIGRKQFPNPDGAAIAPDVQFCYLLDNPIGGGGSFVTYGVYLPLVDAHCGVPCYARSGDDWVMSFNFQPQPFLAMAALSASCGECASFVIGGGDTPGCIPHLGFDTGAAPYGLAGRGGLLASSIGSESALFDLMQIPSNEPRALYARAV